MTNKLNLAAVVLIAVTTGCAAIAKTPAELNDLELAHVAYTADVIDIRYAHLALAISENPAIHEFANSMVRDHTAVNEQALTLLEKLGAQPVDNFLSQSLTTNSEGIIDSLSQLRGADFDKAYASNEWEWSSILPLSFSLPNLTA